MIKYFVKLQTDNEWKEMIYRSDLHKEISLKEVVKQFVEQHPEWYLKHVTEQGEHILKVEVKTENDLYSLFYITINLNYEIDELYVNKKENF